MKYWLLMNKNHQHIDMFSSLILQHLGEAAGSGSCGKGLLILQLTLCTGSQCTVSSHCSF